MPIPALEAYKLQIDADISTQSAPDSIDPSTVGSGYTDLVDIITPYLEFDENRIFSAGTAVPNDLDGSDGDIYFQGETDGTVTLWQKEAGSWVDNGSFTIGSGVPVAGSFDGSGNFDASSFGISDYPTFQVYQSGESIPATYNNTTKIISGGTPGAFVATFR